MQCIMVSTTISDIRWDNICPRSSFYYSVYALRLTSPDFFKTYLAFQTFDFERTR